MKRAVLWTIVLILSGFSGFKIAYAQSDDEGQIRGLLDNFSLAFRAKNADKLMSLYEHSDKLVAFDWVTPRQFTGWDAYRKDFERLFNGFDGPITYDITDVSITTDGNMAYSHSMNHLAGMLKNGSKKDSTVRVTTVYRKLRGKWLIVHEHVSIPVDPATDKGDLQSKP